MGYYGKHLFDPDHALGYLIRRAHQLGCSAIEPIFAAEGITGVQWSALILICLGRSGTGADLSRDLCHDKGATTRLIDTLEQRGWVTRHRCTDDRRIVNLEATAAGQEVAMRLKEEVIACWNELMSDWEDSEVTTLITLLQKLRDTLETATGERRAG